MFSTPRREEMRDGGIVVDEDEDEEAMAARWW